MERAVIFGGGDIDRDFALAFLNKKEFRYRIGADRGIRFMREQGVRPTHIVGDFDSAGREDLEYFQRDGSIPIRAFQPEKDVTDAQIAVDLAIELGCGEIWMLGGMGCRADHLLANIRLLGLALKKGAVCYLIDPWNKIRAADSSLSLAEEEQFGRYVSLFALSGQVTGLTLTGFKYPLSDYTMAGDDPLGVSNEIVAEKAKISFRSGVLIVAESRDHADHGERCR